jgi:outer membrane protein TolC
MLFSVSLLAQEKLSLDECISLALKNSPLLKAEDFNVKEKEAFYKKEKTSALPQIELNSYFERRELGYSNDNVSMDVSFDLQKILLGYGSAEKLSFEGTKWRKKKIKADLVYLVKSAYFNLFLALREYKATEKAFETVKHHRDVAEAMVKSGVKLKSVLLRIDAQLERIKADLLSKRSHIKEAKIELLKLIGLPVSTSIEIEEYKASLPSLPDSSEIIQQVLTQSPELKALEYEYSAIKKELRFSKGFFLPKLSLGTGYNRDGSPGGDGNYQDYHVSVSLPIFEFGKNIHEIQRIKAIKEKIKWQIEEKKREITSRIVTLYEKAKIAREKYNAYKKALEDIHTTLVLSEKEYASGIISESDLLDIERNTVEIEVEKDKAFCDYMILLAEIEYLKGGTE